MTTMKAVVFKGEDRVAVEEVPKPRPRAGEAVIRITTTTIHGAWAEYLLVPDARANLAPIPDGLTDEDVMLCPDIFSTGLAGAERGNITVGDSVAVFAEGPTGLCATIGAKLKGASLIIGIDPVRGRLEVARRFLVEGRRIWTLRG